MSEIRQKIPARLESAVKGGYVAGAKDIVDDALGKAQNVINEEHEEAIADRYTKAETYSKEQLNNLITTPEQKYVTVTASEQTSSATDVLPVTGEANTLYRVGNWDGVSYNTSVYSEYAWDGNQYVFLNAKEVGIDDEPVKDSNNLIKSKSVYENKSTLDHILKQTDNIFTTRGIVYGVINNRGLISTISGYPNATTTDYLPVEPSKTYYISRGNCISNTMYIIGFYDGQQFISREVNINGINSFITPEGCNKIRCSRLTDFYLDTVISKTRIRYIPDKILNNVSTMIDGDVMKLNFINQGIHKCMDKYAINNTVINANNIWNSIPESACYIIPVEEFQEIYIEAGAYASIYAFLSSKDIIIGGNPDFSYKYNYIIDPVSGIGKWVVEEDEQGNPIKDGRHICNKLRKNVTTAPPGTKYLYLAAITISENKPFNVLPRKLIIDGISYTPEIISYSNHEDDKSSVEEYSTVFFDDFNELDENKWTLHTQEPASGGHYNSRFRTDSNNAYVDNSILILGCTKTATAEDGTYIKRDGTEAQVEYRAGYISTQDSFAINAGRISAKMKFSDNVIFDLFPGCFWTFGQNNMWAYAHEMDIAESVATISVRDTTARDGTVIPAGSKLYMLSTHTHVNIGTIAENNHETYYWLRWLLNNNGSYVPKDFITTISPTEWHVYSVEWDSTSLTYFVDDTPVKSFTAADINATDADGNIGFCYPQDIRFNIKAIDGTTGEQGYLFVDWVRAETKKNTPCLSIFHDNITLNVGESIYINPVFNNNCSNKAFTLSIEDDNVLTYYKHLTDASQMIAHRIKGKSPGVTTVTLRAANERATSTFTVTVVDSRN